MYQARIINVFIASPSDLKRERNQIPAMISKWNGDHGERLQTFFHARMWEFDLPHGGFDAAGPQHLIDTKVLAGVDACIAMFWAKMGVNGLDGKPNTAHEIDLIRESNRPTYVWIKEASIPTSIVNGRLEVDRYVSSVRKSGYLTGSFKSGTDLRELLTKVLFELASDSVLVEDQVESQSGSNFNVSIRRADHIGNFVLANIGDADVSVHQVALQSSDGTPLNFASSSSPGLIAPNGTWREMVYFPSAIQSVSVIVSYSHKDGVLKNETLDLDVVA